MSEVAARRRRVGDVIGAVASQALADWGARRVALLDDGSPEARLAADLLEERLPTEALVRVIEIGRELESLLQLAGRDLTPDLLRVEGRRLRARLLRDALVALPANKTALLLGGPLPPEPLLPLGDLYASEVATLADGWSAPAAVRALAERAGGIGRLDAALREWLGGREGAAWRDLPMELRGEITGALRSGAASRTWPRVVPKLGNRTLGVDLFE